MYPRYDLLHFGRIVGGAGGAGAVGAVVGGVGVGGCVVVSVLGVRSRFIFFVGIYDDEEEEGE